MAPEFTEIIRRHAQPMTPIPTGIEPVLRLLPGLKAVLFDVYGTLFVSASGDIGAGHLDRLEKAYVAAIRDVGIEECATDPRGAQYLIESICATHKRLRADGIKFPEVDIVEMWANVLDRLACEGRIEERSWNEHTLKRLALEYEMRINPVWSMPECREVLSSLQNGGLTLGIISNAQFFTPHLFPALLGENLDELGFHERLLFYSFEHRQAKPGLYLYRSACNTLMELGVSPEATLYVGNDMRNDVAPAVKAGFCTGLFAGDQRSLRLREDDEQVNGIVPDLVLTSLKQLAPCVRNQQLP